MVVIMQDDPGNNIPFVYLRRFEKGLYPFHLALVGKYQRLPLMRGCCQHIECVRQKQVRRIMRCAFEDVVHIWIRMSPDLRASNVRRRWIPLTSSTRAGAGTARAGTCTGAGTSTATAGTTASFRRWGRWVGHIGDTAGELVDVANDFR